jgi:tripartite-type tricarboxylate transporter receptor subunit TctC
MEYRLDRRDFLKGACCLTAAGILFPWDAFGANWPTRPITGVVGFGQGGGVDQTSRTIMPGMEASLKGTINIINKPGAVASIATDFVWKSPSNGYTWLFTATFNDMQRCNGYHQSVPYKDWQFYGIDSSIMSWSVVPDSPIKSFDELLDMARKKPGEITVGNDGVGSTWHLGSALMESIAKVKFKHIAYKGGAEATLGALQKEINVVGSGLHEHVEHVRAGRLRNLAVFTAEPIAVARMDPFDPVTKWLPGAKSSCPYGGGATLALRRDTDAAILKSVEQALLAAGKTDAFLNRLKNTIRFANLKTGAEADKQAAVKEVVTSKILKDLGIAKFGPKDLNLPEIEDFDSWWPPKDYKPRI